MSNEITITIGPTDPLVASFEQSPLSAEFAREPLETTIARDPLVASFETVPVEASIEVIAVEGPPGPKGQDGYFGEPEIQDLATLFENGLI